jgi:cysteine desulfurase
VLEPLRYLEKQGWTLRLVDPAPDGSVDVEKLLAAVDDDTVLVSCMLANSEIGTIAPMQELAKALRRKNKLALLHCDAVQAFGKLPFSASKLGVDLLSVSSHKIHGPKGCGALYVRKGARIEPRTYGGGQERGMRPGTENVPAICGFGLAAEKAAAKLPANLAHVRAVYEYFVNLASNTPGIRINSPQNATPYLCNISVPGYRSEILLHYLGDRGIYVSSGSACSKGARSHVLSAMGLADNLADSALRASFSRYTTTEEVDGFFAGLRDAMVEVAKVR